VPKKEKECGHKDCVFHRSHLEWRYIRSCRVQLGESVRNRAGSISAAGIIHACEFCVPARAASVTRLCCRVAAVHPSFIRRRDEKLTSPGQSFDLSVTSFAARELTVITRATAFNSIREERHGKIEWINE
jgi:hypothetical protein